MSAFCSVPLVQDVVRDLSSHHQAFFNLMPWWHHGGQNWRVTEDNYYFVLYFSSMSCILPSTSHFSRFHKSILIFFVSKPSNVFFVSHPWRSTNTDHITLTPDESIQQDFIYWWRCVAKRSVAEVKDTQPFAWQHVGRLKGNQGDVVAGQEQTGCDVVAADGASSSEAFTYERSHWVQRLNSRQFLFNVGLHYFWWVCFWITSLPKATNVCTLSNDCSRACETCPLIPCVAVIFNGYCVVKKKTKKTRIRISF